MAIDDSVPFLDKPSEPVVLFAQDTRFGARASSLPERHHRSKHQRAGKWGNKEHDQKVAGHSLTDVCCRLKTMVDGSFSYNVRHLVAFWGGNR